MVESVIRWLIALCLLVLCVFLILWVFAEIGIGLPSMVIKIVWIVVALLAILLLVRAIKPHAGTWLP